MHGIVIACCLFGQPYSQTAPPIEPLKLIDLDAWTELHDLTWAQSQPAGPVVYAAEKTDSQGTGRPARPLSLIAGESPTGGKVLRQTITDPEQLHDFWLINTMATGSGVTNHTTDQGYFSTQGQDIAVPYNQLAFKVRYPAGYRSTFCASTAFDDPTSGFPFITTIHVGTYNYDPAKIGLPGSTVVESDGFHFYFRPFIRTDLSNGGWIQVVINEQPHHQRATSSRVNTPNPTRGKGHVWHHLTRIYFAGLPYALASGDDSALASELGGSYVVDFCDFELRYVPPILEAEWLDTKPDREHSVSTDTTFTAVIRNLTDTAMPVRIGECEEYQCPIFLDKSTATIPAFGSTTVQMTIDASEAEPIPNLVWRECGFWVTPDSDYDQTFPTNVSDSNIERRWDNIAGKMESQSVGLRIRAKVTQ